MIGAIAIVVLPIFGNSSAWGGHDWDQMTSHRLLMVKSITEYHQFPFWNPYGCGGHPAWSGVESGTTLVSPWFPLYLLLPVQVAVRFEVLGTALLSAVGTWLLAGRFSSSPALRAFVCLVFVINGRWALQAAAGHAWHLYYAWLPWALYFYDRAITERGTVRKIDWKSVLYGAAVVALMVYSGAIYPLPHTVFILGIYGGLTAIRERTFVPIVAGVAQGLLGALLAAPKLVPVIDTLSRFPRLVESNEVIDLRLLLASLVEPGQTAGSRPVPVPQWGWHEYGMYIGWTALILLVLGVVGARGGRERGLKWLLALLLLLGFGSFHALAPWRLLHDYVPIFKSQHVPSRWQYPAVLIAALLAASFGERLLRRYGAGRRWLELVLLLPLFAIGADIASEARGPLRGAFWMELGHVPELGKPFHQLARAPRELRYRRDDWAPPGAPAMLAGVGVIECVTFPGLNVYAKNADGVIVGLGAKGRGQPGYRGEVFTASGTGRATLRRFTPNLIEVELAGGRPGDLLILNQNYDAGWSAGGQRALEHQDLVATTVARPNELVVFRYRPRTWFASLALFAVTLGGLFWAWRRRSGMLKA